VAIQEVWVSLLGEALSVVTSLLWAASTVISGEALRDLDPIRVNAVRTGVASALMLAIATAAGEMGKVAGVDLLSLGFVTSAAVIGFGVGDTLLLKGMTLIGVSRCYTVAYTYPLFTVAIAAAFLGQRLALRGLTGAVVIVCGIILVSRGSNEHARGGGGGWRGLALGLGTAVCWAVGTVFVDAGLRNMDVILANALRFPLLLLFLLLLPNPEKRSLNRRNVALSSATGVLGMVVGGLSFMLSLQLIGAARATPLSASSPVWASIMSSVFLRERATAKTVAASVIVVVGIYLLTQP